MTQGLISSIETIFSTLRSWHRANPYYGPGTPINNTVKYMEIPISHTFEVPMFLLKGFSDAVGRKLDIGKDCIAVRIMTKEHESRYSSLERIMQDILLEPYNGSWLVKVSVKAGNAIDKYYCTHGAIFNENFSPLMLCSWQLTRGWLTPNDPKYWFTKPVIWIHPSVYTNRATKMNKFIADKVVTHLLQTGITHPRLCDVGGSFMRTSSDCLPKVVIDEFPFVLRDAEVPSISTTNEQLLQLALDHVEEVIQ